jgi:hypothetical protein
MLSVFIEENPRLALTVFAAAAAFMAFLFL